VGVPITVKSSNGFAEGRLLLRVGALYWQWTAQDNNELAGFVFDVHEGAEWAVGTGPDIRAQLRLAGSAG
jgi:hypothetical protein